MENMVEIAELLARYGIDAVFNPFKNSEGLFVLLFIPIEELDKIHSNNEATDFIRNLFDLGFKWKTPNYDGDPKRGLFYELEIVKEEADENGQGEVD